MHQRPRAHRRRAPHGALHAAKHLAQRAVQAAVQLGAVAEARIHEVEDDVVAGGQAGAKLAEEEHEQEFGGVVAVARVEVLFVVEGVQDGGAVLGRDLLLLEGGPLRGFAADDADDGRGRGFDAAGRVVVLSLQDGAEHDGQQRGAEPVGQDGQLLAMALLEAEARDAGVQDGEIDLQVRRVAETLRKGHDAGVGGDVERPDFDEGLLLAVERGEEGASGGFAAGLVADGEDKVREAE